MDSDEPSTGRRKSKFAPKPPSQRKPRPSPPNTEFNSRTEDDASQAQKLMSKFNENLTRQVRKVEKKASVQVAFGPGATSSSAIRSYGVNRNESTGRSSITGSDIVDDEDGKTVNSSTANEDRTIPSTSDTMDALPVKIKKDYIEPWDCHHTYYPTTLPLRRPYSGDPELLNEAEFGEAANKEYDETTINHASDLGLLDENEETKMFLFQFPPKLPLYRRSASAKGKEKADSFTSLPNITVSSLEELPGGCMGKMLVYRSGAVKLKLGDMLYDVSPGAECVFPQNVTAINTVTKHCCDIGELRKRAVVTPDIESLLNSQINPD
ncbi:hypothetical protein K2173_008593 [Erythroxylum novogranatense]|uniref:DNA-directed RNA polymerase III subunit RPC4 n=1 Tax=Erythroxylum novogranatense TaxID=1862640 RepID=A0AAV8SLC2_9ROSI|nr:hypothetical protein K2173_008593 [Erythroxylum novogranatense]